MNRLAFAGAGLLGLGLAGAVVVYAPEPNASAHAAAKPAASAAPIASEEAAASVVPLASTDAGAAPGADGPALIGFDNLDAGTGFGELPPLALPEGTASNAKSVHFGLILVTHSAAQGAPPGARSKADAQALATRLANQAQSDFKGAVAGGDSGSLEDMGRIERGVEPAADGALFTLDPGAVSPPIDTPRGFWIVKRID